MPENGIAEAQRDGACRLVILSISKDLSVRAFKAPPLWRRQLRQKVPSASLKEGSSLAPGLTVGGVQALGAS